MTRRLAQLVLATVMAATTVGLSASFAAQPSVAQDQQAAKQEKSAAGTLDKVDVNAKTIAVKQADNTTIVFSYTDNTKIVGAEQTVAGLATMSGSEVTVRYIVDGNSNVATEVEVHK